MNKDFLNRYPSYKDYYKNFLGGWSFEDGDKTLTIRDIDETEMYDQETGGKKIELTLHFVEESLPMVLNVTNADTIASVLGTGDWGKWIGQQIIVGTSKVKAFGKIHDAIRVRDQKPTAEQYFCDRCGQPVKEGKKLVVQTRQDFGQTLCLECARKANEERKHGG
ncbi:MAG: hypothetical protein IJH05_03625 [Firmicutes bacterium]|nr:hypothetical protein [Bacillota bacterium]